MAKKDNKTKKQENSKNKKSFAKDFKAELKKVVWPTPKQLVNNTVAVIAIVLITAVIVFVLDVIFEAANKYGVDKIKQVITTTNETTENSVSGEDTTSSDTNSNETTENEIDSTDSANAVENSTDNTDINVTAE